MSVDFNARLGLGWVIPAKRAQKMREKLEETDLDWEDYFYSINCYHEESDVFIGEIICGIDPGSSVDALTAIAAFGSSNNESEFIERLTEIIEAGGEEITVDGDWSEARIHMLHFVS